MATAKRLYLYSVSAIGLGLILYAATILGGLLLDQLGFRSNLNLGLGYSVANSQTNREMLSLAIGLVVVGLPLWLFHWSVIERMISGDGPAAAAERQSIVRAFYFGLLLAIAAALMVSSGVDVIREAITRPMNASNGYWQSSLSGAIAGLVMWFGVFAYHAWVRNRDLRQGPTIKNAAAWTSRIFLYWPATGAFVAGLVSAGTVVGIFIQAATGWGNNPVIPAGSYYPGTAPLAGSTAAWWVYPMASALATFVGYGALWLAYWRYAHKVATRTDEQGADERASRVRLAYFVIMVASLASYTLLYLSEALAQILQFVAGTRSSDPTRPLMTDTVVLVVTGLPFIAAWWWHRRRGAWEWSFHPGTALRAVRPMDYFTALVGIVAFSGALVYFIAQFAQKLWGGLGYQSLNEWKSSIVGLVAVMAVAAPIWLWPWLAGQRRLGLDRFGETHSTARKAYLFAVGGVAITAGAIALAFVAYRLTRVIVGLDSSGFGTDVRMPLCILAVAAAYLAYHAFWIRRDQLLAGPADVATPVAPAAVAAVAAATPVAMPAHELVVTGPAGVDLEALRASLAEKLPDGFSIAVRTREGTA